MDELNALGSFNQMIRQIAVLIQETKIATASVSERKILESNSQQSAHSAEAVALAATEITKGTIEQTTEAENCPADDGFGRRD